jgi:hypothetical protein
MGRFTIDFHVSIPHASIPMYLKQTKREKKDKRKKSPYFIGS